ncbi:MAG: glycosyltransferase family 2 protein [Solirubrobacterales bacterium]
MNSAGLRVVVLSYGTGGEYRSLLDGLLAEGLKPETILVVHNPSVPGEGAPSDLGGCEVLASGHNLGYAAGMNLGIERQLGRDCEFLLVLTHDARLRAGSLELLLEAGRANARFGVLGPVLLLSGTESPFSYGGVNSGNGGVGHRKTLPQISEGIAPCDWVDGGTMLIRAAALRQVGGFDERFWGYAEDADLCLRIRRAGFGVGVVPAARADQDPGGTKRLGPWAYLMTRNGLAYARRSAGARGLALLAGRSVFIALYELVRTLARATSLRQGSPREPWAIAVGTMRGMADFMRGRWGPPPPDLPGAGDLRNTAPTEVG